MVDDFYGELMHRLAKMEAQIAELIRRAEGGLSYGPIEPRFGPPPSPPPFPLQPSWLKPQFFVCPICHKLVADGHICRTCESRAD